MLKVFVKASRDDGSGLTQSYLRKADYLGAIDIWLQRRSPKTIFCFVQSKDIPIDSLPRVYLATHFEVAKSLKEMEKGRGDTILYEYHCWGPRAYGADTIDNIADNWRFSQQRLAILMEKA